MRPGLHFLVCVAMLVLAGGCSVLDQRPDTGVHHVVLLWLPDTLSEERVEQIIEATQALGVIPGVRDLRAGRAVPSERTIVDDSFDLGIVMRFGSVEAMDRFLDHPAHKRFVATHVRGIAERLLVYDIGVGY